MATRADGEGVVTLKFPCPYLGGDVELSSERETHIAERHPDLLPVYRERIRDTLAQPGEVRHSERIANARTFSRYFGNILGGKRGGVVSETAPERHWVVTAYLAWRLSGGIKEWTRS